MAKKILKRSLALGALMAFVITGSAMASSTVLTGDITEYYEGPYESDARTVDGRGTMNVIGDLIIKSTGDNAVTVDDNDGGKYQKLTINGNEYNITLDASESLNSSSNANGNAILGYGDLDITTKKGLNLYANNRVIRATEGAKVNLIADTIYMNDNSFGSGNYVLHDDAAIKVDKGVELNVTATNGLFLKASDSNGEKIRAIHAIGDSSKVTKVTIDGGKTTNISGNVFADADKAGTQSVTINIKGETINLDDTIKARSTATKATDKDNVLVALGEKGITKEINLIGAEYGIMSVYEGSRVEVYGNRLNIINENANDNVNGTMGLYAMNATYTDSDNNDDTITTNAQIIVDKNTDTYIKLTDSTGKASGYGAITAFSNGIVDISGNLEVVAKTAVLSRVGYININKANDKNINVKITGDVLLDYDGYAPLDADVVINLANDNSYFEGKIGFTPSLEAAITNIRPSGMKLGLSNGATWYLTDESFANNVSFGAGSNLVIDGAKFVESTDKYALNGSSNDSLKVEKGANLIIKGMEKNTYNIAKGFGPNDGENFTVVNDNALMQAEMVLNDAKELKAVVTAKSADEIVSSGVASDSSASMLSEIAGDIANGDVAPESKPAADFIQNLMSGQSSGNTPEASGAAYSTALQIAEAGGNSSTSLSIVNNVTGITNQRLSFNQMNTAPQGGHGKVERKYKTGAGVWAQYMHGKDKVEDMPMDGLKASYESQYNGAVIGYDFAEVGKMKYGIAFNYGEGDSHSKNSSISTRSDYDFWGIGLYSSIMNDDTNIILDLNYSKSDSDVTQINGATTLEASPETTSLSAGVKVEKLIQKDTVQIVPYAGLRYMTVDTDDYSANIGGKKAFMYAPERQNIWLIPVGVSLRQENTYENGWRVTPKADLSYIWAVGDTDSSMTVSIPGITNVANMNYTVMDNGSFLGTVGIEAEKGDWTYGLSYSYQKGEYQRSDKWFVDVRYSF